MREPLLHRLGAWLARHPWRVVAAWALILAGALPLAALLPGRLATEGAGVLGSESFAVKQALGRDFVNAPGEPWIVVWHGSRPALEQRAAIATAAARIKAVPHVVQVWAPTDDHADPRLLGADGHGACILISTDAGTSAGVEAVRAAAAPLRDALAAADPGVGFGMTGSFPLGNDLIKATGADSGRAERLLLLPVLALLLWVFGSPAAAALPLLLAGAASVLAFAGGALIAPWLGVNAFFQTVVSMLGLALGIDYALLITARFRERRRAGDDAEAAAAATLATAGWTVACAGGVVVASLSALLPLGLMDARSVGLGGALVVAGAVALALGLLPALLVLAAPWLEWPRRFPREPKPGRWTAWSHALLKWRWLVAPLAFVGLLVMARPLSYFEPGVPDMRFYPPELESVKGVEVLAKLGHRGWTDPAQMLVRRKDGGPILGPGGLGPLLALSRAIHADPRVGELIGPVDLAAGLRPTHYALLYARPAEAIRRHPELKGLVSADGRSAVFQVITTDMVDVNGAMALTTAIRHLEAPGLEVQVGGLAALNLDYDAQLAATLPRAIGWLLLATAVILGLMFRAVLVPLKAIVLNLLVVGASIGTLVWVFQLGHGARWVGLNEGLGTLPTLVPMLVFCLTFGLSMDYEVFMIGRVREERRAADGEEQAIARGLEATGGVIVAAAGIMVLVCGAFAGAHMIFVKLFGAGMALAILLDVTVVRLVLAPALLAIAGRWNWWPGER
ncbi:MAG: hypothetical protein JWM80_4212 [Cyanobacteria bacterium RYN_339]|nr:hypothetical protein [Cyanobacteria bacterium RYN_339]